MICQSCGVQFSKSKADAFEHDGEAWCSELCAADEGWCWDDDTQDLTMAVLRQLLCAAQRVEPGRALSEGEQQQLNDAVAIVSFESGAERLDGPPATVAMFGTRLQEMIDKQNWCFGCGSIAQLAVTLAALRTAV